MRRLLLVLGLVLGVGVVVCATCAAAPDFALHLQVYNDSGQTLGPEAVIGSTAGAVYGLDSFDAVPNPLDVGSTLIYSDRPDLAGSTMLLKDIRGPLTTTAEVWTLKIASPLPPGDYSIHVRVWNPAGAEDIDGSMVISGNLYWPTPPPDPGGVLFIWGANANGTADTPAADWSLPRGSSGGFVLSISAALVPEPGGLLALGCGICGLLGLAARRSR